MAITINTTVWDSAENWDNAYSSNVFCPPFPADSGHAGDYPYGANTIWSGYANGNIDIDSFDDTICPWAYGKNAPFLGGMWWIPNNDGVANLNPSHMHPETVEFKMSDMANRPAFPAIFGINSDWQFNRPFVQKYREITDNVTDVETWIDNAGFGRGNGAYTFKPATNFNYNNIACCPRIIYISQVSGSNKTKSEIDALFTGEIGNKYYYFPYSDTEITLGSYTLYSADGIAREWLDTHYVVGISFDFYIVDSNISNPNYNSEFAFGLIENEPFPPLTDSGSFGDYYKHPFNLLGGGLSSAPTSKITIGGFQFFGMGSSNEQLYSKNDWINSAYRNSNGQYNPQPKLFLGVNNEKWTYYGYAAKQRSIQVQQCAPFWVWNGTIDELLEYTKRVAAYIGFPIITRNNNDTINKKSGWDGTGENELLPIFDENGYTTGDYVSGSAATQQPNYDWGSDVWEKTNYTGTPPIDGDPNEYDEDNKTILNIDYQKRKFKFCKGYLLTEQNVMDLSAEVYNIGTTIGAASDIIKEMLEKLFLKDGDPMDLIVSLMFFPFNPAKILVVPPDVEEIMFGAFPTGINAQRWDRELCIIDMGSASLFPHMGDTIDDFRNYAPYTTAELQLPYIGNVDVDPHIFLGHTISVKYVVDLATGAVQALIYRDQLVIDQASGQIGTFIPVRGVDQLEQLTAQQHAAAAYKQARNTQIGSFARFGLSIAAGAAAVLTGGAALAAGAGALAASGLQQLNNEESVNRAEYDLQHIATPFRETGHASSITAYSGEQQVRLIIKRPRMAADYNPQQYGHSIGFATVQTGQIGSFSGFTICSKINLDGIQATSSELEAIQKALQSGVFI